jgi:ferric iron reductase FhuF-like transporter
VTAVTPHRVSAADALAPINAALCLLFGAGGAPGLAPGLLVGDETGWLPATRLTDGSRLPDLLDAARRRWHASPHAAATLAWKAYSYWLALPAVLGWTSARRVPLLRPADVLMRLRDQRPLVTFGLRQSVGVTVLRTDPLARSGMPPQMRVVDDEAGLLVALRESLLDAHLTPMVSAMQTHAKVSTRTLRGSVSSGVAHGVLRATDVLPGSGAQDVDTLLTALGIEDLVELIPGGTGKPTVQRKTCCLAFTLPRPKVCTDCCIRGLNRRERPGVARAHRPR